MKSLVVPLEVVDYNLEADTNMRQVGSVLIPLMLSADMHMQRDGVRKGIPLCVAFPAPLPRHFQFSSPGRSLQCGTETA